MIQINKAVQSTSMDEEFYLKFQLLKVTWWKIEKFF